jgi:hypothetical protein
MIPKKGLKMANKSNNAINIIAPKGVANGEANKDDLFRILDDEIERIRDERQQPGWTKWAISGSLATAFWLLLNELEKGGITITTVFGVIITVSLLTDFIIELKGLLEPSLSVRQKGRFIVTNQLANNRLALLLILARYIVVIYLAYILSSHVSIIASIGSYILIGFNIMGFLMILALSFVRIPISNNLKQDVRIFRTSIIIRVLAIGCLSVVYFLMLLSQSQLIANIRVAGLIIAIYYLIYLITSTSIKSPLMDSLTNIRRELALGHLDCQNATEQIDIAIAGLKISNILQDYVNKILELWDEYNSKMKKVLVLINAIESTVKEDRDHLSDEQKATVESLKSSIKPLISDVHGIVAKKIPAALKPLGQRVDFIESNFDISRDEVDEVIRVITTAMENSNSQLEIIDKKVTSLEDIFLTKGHK